MKTKCDNKHGAYRHPNEHRAHTNDVSVVPRAYLLAWAAGQASGPKLFIARSPPLNPLCGSYVTSAASGWTTPSEWLDLMVKYLYFYKTMNDSLHHGSLATRLAALQQQVEGSRFQVSGRPAGQPRAASTSLEPGTQNLNPALLIGASKSQPVTMLEAAIALGLMDFGENKVQEAQGKWPALKAKYPQVRLHLIGPLQSNKAADAVLLFDVIHTIDRTKIADALASACEKLSKRPAMLLQVNTGEEPQKAGVAPREVASLLAHCRGLGLPIIGLMCVPPEGENPAPHFALLKKMAYELGLPELSMGMSGDYETALRLGATMIRVGTALFGSRL